MLIILIDLIGIKMPQIVLQTQQKHLFSRQLIKLVNFLSASRNKSLHTTSF